MDNGARMVFFSEGFNQFSTLKHDFESQNFEIFEFQGQLSQKFLNSFYFICLSPTLVLESVQDFLI